MKIKNSLIVLFVFTALYVCSLPVMAQFTFTPGLVMTVNSNIDASDALPGDTTLERRYTVVRPSGKFEFSGLPYADVYILEIKAKRAGGAITPQVFGSD